MFSVLSTEDVLAETMYRLRRNRRDLDGGVIYDLRAKFEEAIDEILKDFQGDIEYQGADPDDKHVHAAAVAGDADYLLTEDRGFVWDDDTPYEVYTCDEFFMLIDDGSPISVQRVVSNQLAYYRRNGNSKSLVDALRDAGCPQFAQRIEDHLRTLSGPSEQQPLPLNRRARREAQRSK